jgi:hypothetical protein
MAQLDTRIATSIAQPQAISPFKTLGQLAQLKDQQGLNRQRQLENEKRRRDLEDDDALTESLQRHGNVDDAIDDLYQQGRADIASALSTHVNQARKAALDRVSAQADADKKRIEMATNIFQTVSDQKSLETATAAARPIIGDDLMQYVPKEYGDGAGVKQIVGWGTSRQEYLAQQQNVIANAHKAADLSNQAARDWETRQENKRKAAVEWTKTIGNALALTPNQDEWDTYQRLAVDPVNGLGVPAPVVAQFGSVWSPAAVTRAKKLAMTPAEQDASANAASNVAAREREVKVREDLLKDQETRGGRQLTPNAVSDIEGDTQRRYDALEKDAREIDPRTGRSLRDMADDPSESGAGARRELAQRKLTIENGDRRRRGMPTIEEAEQIYAQQGDQTKLRQVRNAYKKLTGDVTPMEKVEQLFAQIKAEKDPVKIAALRKQLAEARAAVDGSGR